MRMLLALPFLFKHFACAAVLLTFVWSASAQSNLWNLVRASHDQAKSLNYSGLLTIESGKYSQSSKLLHYVSNQGEFEVLERLDGQSVKWIRHNDQIQCVIPEQKLILTERRHTSMSFPLVFSGSEAGVQTLEKLYDISELSGRRVAGRAVRVFQINPKDELRYEYRLHLDRESNLLMRSELYSPDGEVLEQVGFKEISFEPKLNEIPSLIKPGPDWTTSSTEVKILAPNELFYDLPDLAFGFRKMDTLSRIKGKSQQIHQTVYSDGLSTLSLFVHKVPATHSMSQVPISHGAVMARSEIQSGHMVTVLGEVPEKTLKLFLKSVRWKTQ